MRGRWAVVLLGALILVSGCRPSAKAALKVKGYDFTPGDFCKAVRAEAREEVRLFLKAGMSPDAGGALCAAASEGSLAMTALLLDAGAKVDGECVEGTPLLQAARGGFSEVVELLAGRGAKVDAADPKGITVLMYAADRCDMTSVNALLEHKADATRKDLRGWTAWTFASERGQRDMADALSAAGAETFVDPTRDQFMALARQIEPVFAGSIQGEKVERGKRFEKDVLEFRRLALLVCCQMEGNKEAVEGYLAGRGCPMTSLELKMRLWGTGECGPCPDPMAPPPAAPAEPTK